ncbi:hypothetical protein ACHHYP_20595 [Achlya hypogyna]|uniref:SWIM-type domain-containing protein n=1 Tax=Achlya hypogyna TaxID=1202772 RepID=A0A1V9YHP5_ACHHY|nr:hypothetical protein ACHHYP_20595 [Achlya hypogyna]
MKGYNVEESIQNSVRRNLPFASLFLSMRDAMLSVTRRRKEVEALLAKPNTSLTPFAAGHCATQKALSTNCTCPFRDQMHLPCRHVIRALAHVGGLDDGRIMDFFIQSILDVSFHLPILEHRIEDPSILPPAMTKRVGKPRTESKVAMLSSRSDAHTNHAHRVLHQMLRWPTTVVAPYTHVENAVPKDITQQHARNANKNSPTRHLQVEATSGPRQILKTTPFS